MTVSSWSRMSDARPETGSDCLARCRRPLHSRARRHGHFGGACQDSAFRDGLRWEVSHEACTGHADGSLEWSPPRASPTGGGMRGLRSHYG